MTSFLIRWWLIWNEFITGIILFHLSTDILQHFIFHNSTINVVARRGLIIMLNDAKMFTIHNEYTIKHKYMRITMYVIVCVRKSRHPSSILLCVISNGRKIQKDISDCFFTRCKFLSLFCFSMYFALSESIQELWNVYEFMPLLEIYSALLLEYGIHNMHLVAICMTRVWQDIIAPGICDQ